MKIEDLYKFVLPELPDCPDETLRQAFVLTAIDFCRFTHAWNEIADAARLVSGEAEYDIDYPSGSIAETVASVWCGPRELRAISMTEISVYLPDWQTAESSEPVYYNMPGDWGVIRLYPRPKFIGMQPTITLRGVFKPKVTATDLPNWMVESYLECLCSGVKSRLMLQPKQKWSEPQLGAYHKAQYELMRADARIDKLADRVPGVTRVRPVRFGG